VINNFRPPMPLGNRVLRECGSFWSSAAHVRDKGEANGGTFFDFLLFLANQASSWRPPPVANGVQRAFRLINERPRRYSANDTLLAHRSLGFYHNAIDSEQSASPRRTGSLLLVCERELEVVWFLSSSLYYLIMSISCRH
jgi:hypothetical protein